MKMVKSLILGSAAGLIAMSGAQAADLPVKAKAVEYVRICSLYGAGFFYIPGTDTCIKAGWLRSRRHHVQPPALAPTAIRRMPATRAKAIVTAITSSPVPVWQSRLIPVLPPIGVVRTFEVRATSSSTTSDEQSERDHRVPGRRCERPQHRRRWLCRG